MAFGRKGMFVLVCLVLFVFIAECSAVSKSKVIDDVIEFLEESMSVGGITVVVLKVIKYLV